MMKRSLGLFLIAAFATLTLAVAKTTPGAPARPFDSGSGSTEGRPVSL
jgi:hypothetical protein